MSDATFQFLGLVFSGAIAASASIITMIAANRNTAKMRAETAVDEQRRLASEAATAARKLFTRIDMDHIAIRNESIRQTGMSGPDNWQEISDEYKSAQVHLLGLSYRSPSKKIRDAARNCDAKLRNVVMDEYVQHLFLSEGVGFMENISPPIEAAGGAVTQLEQAIMNYSYFRGGWIRRVFSS